MEYTWKIKQLTKQHSGDLENVIVGTRWEVTGTDADGYTRYWHQLSMPFQCYHDKEVCEQLSTQTSPYAHRVH